MSRRKGTGKRQSQHDRQLRADLARLAEAADGIRTTPMANAPAVDRAAEAVAVEVLTGEQAGPTVDISALFRAAMQP